MQNSQTVKNSLWETPETWEWLTLKDAAEWKSGGTPLSSEKSYYGGDIPWLIIGDLNDGLVTSAQKSITQIGLDNSSVKRVKKGAILIAMYGSIGKLGIAGIDCTTNQAIAFTNTLSEEVDDKYLFYYLMHLRGYLFTQGKGGAQQNISLTVLNSSPFVRPPFPEQKRLVSKIEVVLQSVEQSRKQIQFGKKLINKFRQSVLSAAVIGKLTEEWREKNSEINSDDLLNRIKNTRSENKGKVLEIKQYERDEYPFVELLPDTWLIEKIGNMSNVQGGIQKTPDRAPKNNAYPYLRVANVYRGFLKLDEIVKFEITNDELEKLRLKKGDLLIVEGNGSVDQIGRCAIWNGEIENCIHQNHIIRCRPFTDIESEYLLYYLNSPIGIDTMVRISSSTSGLNTLSVNKIKDIIVPLPPFEEQREIVRRVKLMFDTADLIEKQIETASNKAYKLTQSILAKAFRGEL